MKKILLCTLLLVCVVGCNHKHEISLATVINNDGKKESLSAEDLIKINEDNNEKFKKYYVGAKISFESAVEKVETSNSTCYNESSFEARESGLTSVSGVSYTDKRPCVTINFENNFKILIPNGIIDAAEVNIGDKYKVDSNIAATWNSFIECFGVEDGGAINFNETKIIKIN